MEATEEIKIEKPDERGNTETEINPVEDTRLEFMYRYLSKSIRVKADKWAKLLSVEEYKIILLEFLDTTKIEVITFALTIGSQLVVYEGFPEEIRSKLVYFIRKEKKPITVKNLHNILIYGDLASSPVDELAVWVDQICVPLLSNTKNHDGWPVVVADDIRKHVHQLKNIVYEVKGKLHGQTLLPMPLGIEKVYDEEKRIRESHGEDLDIYLKCEIEGTVIKWATQISRVLNEDSSCAFEGGKNPTPDTEFAFWSNRLANLECIYNQLRELRVQKMALILELTDSAYYPCFKSLFRNVVTAVVEARDIDMYLKPLKNQIDAMQAIEYDQIKPCFTSILCTLCLIWAHSRYYCSSSKIVVILKEICNELIRNGCTFLQPNNLFQGDIDESMLQISKVIDILESFRIKFDIYKEKVITFFPEGIEPVLWTFNPEEVFVRTNAFLERLRLIETLFRTANEYMKLEKIEIGGLKGRALSLKIQESFEVFQRQFTAFGSLAYDPLIPEDESFIEDYENFQKVIEDLDRKLASVFCQAFEDCHNIESLFKFLHITGTLLERKIIKETLENKYIIIPTLLENELVMTKILFEEQSHVYHQQKYIQVDTHFPPVAGTLGWIHKLKERISVPVALFKDLDNPITNSENSLLVLEKYEELMSSLESFEEKVFSEWAKSVPDHCNENLQKQLLVRERKTSLLKLNFDNMLQAVLREVRYLKLMGKENIPEEAEMLYERKDDLTMWIHKLHHAIGWYNGLRSVTQPVEFDLVIEEIEMVDSLISQMQKNLNWNSSDAISFIQDVHDLLKCLHVRTHEAQNNVVLIGKLMTSWSSSPLFGRKDNKKNNLLHLDDHDDRLIKRYLAMQHSGEEILKLIRRNYHLYLDVNEEISEVKQNEYEKDSEDSKMHQNHSDVNNKSMTIGDMQETNRIDEEITQYKGNYFSEVDKCPQYQTGKDNNQSVGLQELKTEYNEVKDEVKLDVVPKAVVDEIGIDKEVKNESKSLIACKSTSIRPTSIHLNDSTLKYSTHSNEQFSENDKLTISVQMIEKRQRFSVKWRKYIDYIDGIVLKGVLSAVGCSLHYLMEEMDDSAPPHPLFEVGLELQEPHIIFVPSLDEEDPKGFLSLIKGLLNDIIAMADLVPRVNAVDERIISSLGSSRTSQLSNQLPQLDSFSKHGSEERGEDVGKTENEGHCESGEEEDEDEVTGENEEEEEEEEEEEGDEEEEEDDEWEDKNKPFINRVSSFIREETKDHNQDIKIQIPSVNYRECIVNNIDICDMKNETLSRVRQAMAEAEKYSNKFEKYAYLWLEDHNEHLQYFLIHGHPLDGEEEAVKELHDDEEGEEQPAGPTLTHFKEQIDYYGKLYDEIDEIEISKTISSWFKVDIRPFKQSLLNTVCKWGNLYKKHLADNVVKRLSDLSDFTEKADFELQKPVKEGEYENLVNIIDILYHVRENQSDTDQMFEPIKDTMEMLKTYGVEFPEEIYVQLQELPEKWATTKKIAAAVRQSLQPLMASEVNIIRRKIVYFDLRQNQYRNNFRKSNLFRYDCENAYDFLDNVNENVNALEREMLNLQEHASKFEVTVPDFKMLKLCRREIQMLKVLWDYILIVQHNIDEWKTTPWKKIDVDCIEMECKKYGKELRSLDKDMRGWDVYISLEATLKNLLTSLRAVTELQNPAIRERHWAQLMEATKVQFIMSDSTILADLLALNLHNYEEDVKNIVDKAVKETSMEKILRELNATWSAMNFEYEKHERTGVMILVPQEELIETLEENQVQLQNLMSSKYISYFLQDIAQWQQTLSNSDQIIQIWFEVQRTWTHLESIFIGSEDIRNQLPEESGAFDEIDKDFRILLKDMVATPSVLEATSKSDLCEKLEELQHKLVRCEKALADYLETKRKAFPRFYFISHVDLLDILSNGNQPELVARHLCKLYDSMAKLKFSCSNAVGMIAKDGEYVQFNKSCDCSGKVEQWLNGLTNAMRKTIRHYFHECINTYEEKAREQWIFDYPAQVALVGTQIWWATEVNIAFSRLEEGYEHALKEYQKKQIQQLNVLITLLCGELSDGTRQKIMTICTIDVHSRDVIAKMIQMKVDTSQAFQWQSQLRHRWDEKARDCFCNICDAQFRYSYEYLGCTPRLVITPLTDRCYITLTQSLHLVMGGAPAGPAGTGKTETTKDLGRAMGVMVYVFNCSEQMDYKSCGNIYKGLAQTGAWGCFDEFNRISVEVLSVVSVQVKSVLDAVKMKKLNFNFMGEEINLVPTVGMFITMNPGYAGRTELPENLKTLFRPCAMVVPDFELICEIMLVAEGFQDARVLARKFITLYQLCRELLSKQDHYDWGLRAIKSVLVVAGALKRGDRERPEDQVLMRALRDFNIPKIVSDDIPIFMGLIGDLFPALEVPRKRDLEFEKLVKQSAVDLKLQPEDTFILKIVQLEELLEVRHSVFIVGNAGSGKTMVWRTLLKTYQNQKLKPVFNDLNPKAVTNDELFGIINPATREWKDGLLSVLMRDQASMTGSSPKWIVLDGDIDPMWIESLNSVMDDNKVLTLASNERISLTPVMRLIFEISHLRTATPATVSRAGILYINPQDLGWNPFVTSWIDKRQQQTEKSSLIVLFDKYVPSCLEALRTKLKRITPMVEISHVQMLCHLLDCLLTPSNVPNDCPKEWYEIYFVFSCIWAFGSALFQDQLADYRAEFSKWWVNEFKVVKFPPDCNVFNYYIDSETKNFLPWSDKIREFDLDYEIPLQTTLVDTCETARLRFFLDLLIDKKVPVMLVGAAGSGKTVIISDKLNSLSEDYAVTNVPFNFYTTSEMLQKILEKALEKKAGRNFAPKGNKIMVYTIDDMNMPEVDPYGTVQPHTLIRQYMDYGHWYDRSKLTLKDIHNCLFVASMNPTAGSFTISPRLQRHFCVFALNYPSGEPLFHIYSTILEQHLSHPNFKFPTAVKKCASQIISVTLQLHQKMSSVFLPTAVKFHYLFNLRDLSNLFQSLLFTTPECLVNESAFIRLWMHEAMRVYGDKLVDENDIESFNRIINDIVRKGFEQINENEVFHKPLIFCHFADGLGESKYLPIRDWNHLQNLLKDAISQYNDLVAAMNLVLFEDAMSHVCRINRIVEGPRGNALLVGVGGSGKQSLSRVAAFISTLEVFQIQLSKGYGISDMKFDIASLYLRAGLKNVGTMFLMTDAQVASEKFLVLINDMLASGEISDLFADDEIENVVAGMRNEVKTSGLQDTKEICWKFFIEKVRRNMKVMLCFSPVGSTLRIRARKFPALINCTSINWFHSWPQDALESVSSQFLQDIHVLPNDIRKSVSVFMAYVHTSVNDMSVVYLRNERRHNYTTPKTFLEQISLYSKLLTQKTQELESRIVRLENGLLKLASTEKQVDGLKEILVVQEIEVNEKNEQADQLIKVVSAEQEKVSMEKMIADGEEAKVRVIEEDVSIKQKICEADLAKAEPSLIAAQEALNTLNKNNLTELKSFGSPPDAVVNVVGAVMVLFSQRNKIPKDRSWKACKMMMGKVDAFLDSLLCYDKDNIHHEIVKAVREYLNDPEFNPDHIRSKSFAAAGLCAWVINIVKYNEVFEMVKPKRAALKAANAELAAAREKLKVVTDQIKSLEDKLAVLTREYQEAVAKKEFCQKEADKTATTIDLANRLVMGLGSENIRWRESLAHLKTSSSKLPGDILMITAFISYVGCFTRQYRSDLLNKYWLPFITTLKPEIMITDNLDPLTLLTDDAQVAKWNNEGLPSDRMSAENATILSNSSRWPLMIDPQLQGLKWIKNKYSENLKVIQLGNKSFMEIIEISLSQGYTVLIENIGETIDAVLDPLLGRNFIKKGTAIKIGDKEVDFNPNFRLILHTKLANPHYKPEMQAQTTLINFTVTRDGLEEQLLAEVVKAERPDLEALKSELTKQQNDFKITLKELEDDLLHRLASAGEDILSDVALVENLETTKRTAAEIELKVAEAKLTGEELDVAREQYRSAAARGSLLYFILNDLHKINPIYQFSLKAFSVVFKRAIDKAESSSLVAERVANLLDNITFSVFMYTSRGLFECDKLIFLAQMTIQILLHADEIEPTQLDFLLRFPCAPNTVSPVDFLSNTSWGALKVLSTLDDFRNLDHDIESSSKRWKAFVDSQCPEKEKFPQEWKNKTLLERLCMMRCLRPDRMTYAVRLFVEEKLGSKFTEARSPEFSQSYKEMNKSTPVFFILSPGVDPLNDVEKLGKRLGYTLDKRNFHNVSLGQGQEPVAEEALTKASRKGHWVILQNIHLVKSWLPYLEEKIEHCNEIGHKKFRLFMSAEPAPEASCHVIPPGILESSIKITNEPPTGMQANLHKALDNFSQDVLEICSKEAEFKAILFSLCYFHAAVAERRKFGPQGWNRVYPFNFGDLTISVNVLYNYLESNSKVPWEDLRYLFGEIMYGGHITDDWDRHLCRTYLEEYMKPELIEGDLSFAPSFVAPPNLDYSGYHKYIDDHLPPESPYLYGLHPNAEIGVLTTTSKKLFQTVLELQPRDAGAGSGTVSTKEEKIKQVLEDTYDKIPDEFKIAEMMGRVEDRNPYILVAFQECEQMNFLTNEMKKSLKELELGLKGELTISRDMELLMDDLFIDKVPQTWMKKAYPSILTLGPWFADFLLRIRELEGWSNDFVLPASVWLSGFFNPQSFLTAIMQSTARKNDLPLDRMCLTCEVTKKHKDDFASPPREGAHVHGLFMEGAQWDIKSGGIINARLKELYPAMPVIYIKAITQDKQDLRNLYECPVYKTRIRGQTYVWTFNLKTKQKPAKWTLAGVALLLQV